MHPDIGPFRIDRELGRGGMGVVYLGHDTRLDRPVAVKTLPADLAADPDRLARFQREAKVLASLSHPNIAAIHGLEHQDDHHYLILEYVKGEDLATILDRAPLPLHEALSIARQIAEALAAAHEKGIVHRDIKPGNIMLTPEGAVKVLDFGLARTDESAPSTSWPPTGGANSPTVVTPPAHSPTIPGAIMGTAGYMSPEQVRAKSVDKRSDIFSFGCVLFEMLAGRQPFPGETPTDSLGAILHREPDWSLLPPTTPAAAVRLLRRCLQKDRRQRLHDIADARIELDDILSGASADPAPTAPPITRTPRRALLLLAPACIALGALLAVPLLRTTGLGAPAPAPAPDPGPTPARFFRATEDPALEIHPTLSPDAATVVYASNASGNFDVYWQRVGGFLSTNLTPDSEAGDTQPALSPDGERIAFRSERDGGGIFIMGATGESPRRLTDFGFNPAWSPDGASIACATEGVVSGDTRLGLSSLHIIDVATGESRLLLDADAVQPSWSPRGDRIAFWRIVGDSGQRDIFTVPAAGGEPLAVTSDAATDWNPVWSPDGRYLYFCSNRAGAMGLWRIPIDESTGQTRGRPEPIAQGGAEAVGHLAISRSGTRLAHILTGTTQSLWLAPFNAETATLGEGREVSRGTFGGYHEISPDGRWLALTRSGSGQEDIFLVSTHGSQRHQLTSHAARHRGPRWSPDGKRLAFYSDRDGDYAAWIMNDDGSGLRRISPPGARYVMPVWSPDASRIACSINNALVLLDPAKAPQDQSPITIFETADPAHVVFPGAWSPDGEHLSCYVSDKGPCILNVESRVLTPVPEAPGAVSIHWLPGGRRFLITSATELIIYDLDTLAVERRAPLDLENFSGASSLSPDAATITYHRVKPAADIWMIDLAAP